MMTKSGNSLSTLTFHKDKILKCLKENRETHFAIVKEAQLGYRQEYEKLLTNTLAKLKDGDSVPSTISLRVPDNYVGDFDRVIQMLEMCVEEFITLTEGEFRPYVMNQWSWTRDFIESNSQYSGMAHRALQNG